MFGYPDLGWFGAIYNFKDKTDHFNSIIGQLYVRQALAHLEDQPAYLTGIFKNAGVLAYGPVPSSPPTPFTPANAKNNPYPFNPSAAVALLKSHGWKVVPNGQTTCAKAGTAANECGAGIPAGTPFKFTWFYIPATATPVKLAWSRRRSPPRPSRPPASTSSSSRRPSTTWSPPSTTPIRRRPSTTTPGASSTSAASPTTCTPPSDTVFNTTGDLNTGGYSNPQADKLINDSVYGSNPKAVTNEASFLTANQPILFTPNTDLIFAVSKHVGGPAASFLSLTQYISYPQYWYVTK